jgi:hypothetical protein
MEPLHAHDPAMIGGYRLLSRLGAGGMGHFEHDHDGVVPM